MTAVHDDSAAIPSCHGGLENLDDEHAYWVTDVEGTVPPALSGTFLRNGPGRQRIGGEPFGHWFDGDGMLAAFSFVDGRCFFKNRYVRTPKYVDETREQRIMYRGFGTQIPGGVRANVGRYPANPANTSVVWHGGRLLACNEGGRPWEVRPDTLDTVGEFDYDGRLGRTSFFSAHPKIHPGTGDLFNFGPGFGGVGRDGPRAALNVFRVDRTGTLARKGKVALQTAPFAHDFVITDRYAVFFVNSIVFRNMGSFIVGRTSIADQVAFDADIPMRIVVVDLDTFETVRTFETEPGAIIHFANAWQSGDRLIIDGMYASDFEANEVLKDVFGGGRFNGGRYHRYELDMTTGAVKVDEVSEHESEFPVFDPRLVGAPNTATWTVTSSPNGADSFFNGFQRVGLDGDVQQVTLEPGMYASEPMLVPATTPGGDDGWILMVVYDAHRHTSELRIWPADDLRDHVATLRLEHHLPHQFHGLWASDLVLAEATGA